MAFLLFGSVIAEEAKKEGEEELSEDMAARKKALETQKAGGGSSDSEIYISRAPYYTYPTMRIPVIRNGEIYAYVFIKYEFKARDDQWPRLKFLRPRFQSNLFLDLYNALGVLWNGHKDPEPEVLKKRALFVADNTFGKGAILDVFFHRLSTEYLKKDFKAS